MNKEEFKSLTSILKNVEHEVINELTCIETDIKDKSKEELESLYIIVNDIRFPAADIYARALGVSGKLKNRLDEIRDKKSPTAMADHFVSETEKKVDAFTKKMTDADAEKLLKILAGMK
jgi:hypothetical protein